MTAHLLDFPSWFHHNIINRRIPVDIAAVLLPAVVMKVDIEGDDEMLFAALVRDGSLCHVNYAYVEHVSRDAAALLTNAMRFAACNTTVEWLDDEMYHNDLMPFDAAAL